VLLKTKSYGAVRGYMTRQNVCSGLEQYGEEDRLTNLGKRWNLVPSPVEESVSA
jgi:hypothetical protein